MTGEFVRRPLIESPVRTTPIVFLSPGFDKLFCLGQRFEPMHVEAFIAKCSVERFDECVVCWLARTGKIDLCSVLICHRSIAWPANSLPLSQNSSFGTRPSYFILFSVRTTPSPLKLWPTSIPDHGFSLAWPRRRSQATFGTRTDTPSAPRWRWLAQPLKRFRSWQDTRPSQCLRDMPISPQITNCQ